MVGCNYEGTRAALRGCINDVNLGRPPRQHSVEAHLASVLKEKGVAVKCDTSIKYTIVR